MLHQNESRHFVTAFCCFCRCAVWRVPAAGRLTPERGGSMARYLMSSHGAARVTEQPPGGCQYVGTVTADGVCYRVLRAEDKTLYAARAGSIF